MKKFSLVFILLLIISCAQEQEKVDTEKEEQALMELSREWSKVAATDDIDKIVSYWSDDAIFMISGQPTLTGKQSIRDMVEEMFNTPGFTIKWEPISASVSESGDMAYLIEKNTMTVNDSLGNPMTSTSRIVSIWKKNENGDWKNVVEVDAADPE
ncbi:YybH family protein [Sediminicola luteus]|uniref:DUF4440 domain-containing protein n=1 Tax=Sediminicola luteus TaxID=319238 RepID=A0ABV2TWZ1_9FLAO